MLDIPDDRRATLFDPLELPFLKPRKVPRNRSDQAEERDPADFYPTPSFVTLSIADFEALNGGVWDPCCGDGELLLALKHRYGPALTYVASDLYDHGCGVTRRDFLNFAGKRDLVDNLITNPPFDQINQMLPIAYACARHKLLLFARLAILEGQTRYRILSQMQPSRIYVYTERITMYSRKNMALYRLSGKKLGSSKTACAWFVWDKQSTDLMKTILIPPGQKRKYDQITTALRTRLNQRWIERNSAEGA